MTGDTLVSALGLWLSVVTLALACTVLSYRWGQARERQRQQRQHQQAPRAPADVAAATGYAPPAQRAQVEQERQVWHACARQAQLELLRAAALPMVLARAAVAQNASGPQPPSQRLALEALNPAAAALWADAQPGQPLQALLDRLSGPADSQPGAALDNSVGQRLSAALPDLAPGAHVEAGGWKLARLSSALQGPDTWLLAASGQGWAASAGQASAPAPAGPPAGAATSATATAAGADFAGENENFSYTLSHDLRAPIRVVEGFTRIVKEDYGRLLDRVGNDHLDRVLSAAARMNLMIDALLTLARLSSQPLARQPVNLSQLAHYVVDELRRQQPEREAQLHIEAGLTAIGDPTLLRLVLENLLGNAWKYSARSAGTHIEFKRETVDGRPAFVVRDQGAGFDMRSADRLFGLFQRLHSANDFPGTGVGLASVRRIVRRHGGEIWAEAEPGHGASFYFSLGG